MSISDLRSRMQDVAGIDDLTMRMDRGMQVFTINGASASVGAFASDSEIETAIRSASRLPPVNITEETKPMTITGQQPGAIQAKLAALKQKAQDRRNQSMAKLDAADAKLASVDAAIERAAAQMEKEADDGLQEFATFTNGGPEL